MIKYGNPQKFSQPVGPTRLAKRQTLFAPKPGLHPRPQPAQLNATPGGGWIDSWWDLLGNGWGKSMLKLTQPSWTLKKKVWTAYFPYWIYVIPKSLSRLAIGWVRKCGLVLLVVEPTHLKNMRTVKMGSSSPNRDENKKYLKPPPTPRACVACFVFDYFYYLLEGWGDWQRIYIDNLWEELQPNSIV